jgi:hypothetical protein
MHSDTPVFFDWISAKHDSRGITPAQEIDPTVNGSMNQAGFSAPKRCPYSQRKNISMAAIDSRHAEFRSDRKRLIKP